MLGHAKPHNSHTQYWLYAEPIPLFTYDCRPVFRSSTIVKFVDNLMVTGLNATMRQLTEKGYSTQSHDAWPSSSMWTSGRRKEAHITSSTWMEWLSSVPPASWGPTSRTAYPGPPTSKAWSRRTTWTFIAVQLRMSQQSLSQSCMEAAQSLNASHYSRRWKLQIHQRNTIYNHWAHQQDILTEPSWQHALTHWIVETLTIFTSNKPTSMLSWVHTKWNAITIEYSNHIKTYNNTWPEDSRLASECYKFLVY